jgi:hypothetical protein
MIAILIALFEVGLTNLGKGKLWPRDFNTYTFDNILVSYNPHRIDTKTRQRTNNGALRIVIAE